MAQSNFIHVDLRAVPRKGDIRAKSADVVRISPDMAMINLNVRGEPETVRFDLAKQVFLDSLGSKKLDLALEELRGPITVRIGAAKAKTFQAGRSTRSRRFAPKRSREAVKARGLG